MSFAFDELTRGHSKRDGKHYGRKSRTTGGMTDSLCRLGISQDLANNVNEISSPPTSERRIPRKKKNQTSQSYAFGGLGKQGLEIASSMRKVGRGLKTAIESSPFRSEERKVQSNFRKRGNEVQGVLFGQASMKTRRSKRDRSRESLGSSSSNQFLADFDDGGGGDSDVEIVRERQVIDIEESQPSEQSPARAKRYSSLHPPNSVGKGYSPPGAQQSPLSTDCDVGSVVQRTLYACSDEREPRRFDEEDDLMENASTPPTSSEPGSISPQKSDTRFAGKPQVNFRGNNKNIMSNSFSPAFSGGNNKADDNNVSSPANSSFSLTKVNGAKSKKKKARVSIIPGDTLRPSFGELPDDPIQDDSVTSTDPTKRRSKRLSQSPYFTSKQKTSQDLGEFEWTEDIPDGTTPKTKQVNSAKTRSSERRRKRSNGLDPSKFHGTPSRKSSRILASKEKKKKKPVMLDLVESSDEESDTSPAKLPQLKEDAVRIAFGSEIQHSSCRIGFVFHPGVRPKRCREILVTHTKRRKTLTFKFSVEDIEEIKYALAGDDVDDTTDRNDLNISSFDESEQMTFLAMRIRPTERNGLLGKRDSYNECSMISRNRRIKNYVLVELRSDAQLKKILRMFKKDEELAGYAAKECKLESYAISDYAGAFLEDSNKEKRKREESLGSPRKRRNKPKSKKPSSEECSLVFPFGVEESELDAAAEDLNEARFVRENGYYVEEMQALDRKQESFDAEGVEEDANGGASKTRSRRNKVTIFPEDRERLSYGEFLNDSLIDFWMQWIWHKERAALGGESDVHFFTSHFYTTLKDEGPAGVASWTARKGIDVFSKKLIFIPVNQSLHWSLCVVVNPGLITLSFAEEYDLNDEVPCILFLDSLKAHRKAKIAKDVRSWLNFEWKRKNPTIVAPDSKAVFSPQRMKVLDPRIPYQNNSWDCGVFVCRYAFNIYTMRYKQFTFGDARENPPFQTLITESSAFDFGMDDIERLREEMGVLIDRLSTKYRPWHEAEVAKEKEERRKAREAKQAKLLEHEQEAAEKEANAPEAPSDDKQEGSKDVEDEDSLMDVDGVAFDV